MQTWDDKLLLGNSGSVTVNIANRIGRDIIGGRIPPGTTIPNETELCVRFAVGRSAVREAVKMLTAKGMMETRPRRGTQVLPVRSWNLFDRDVLSWLRDSGPDLTIVTELLELRLGIEPRAAALAAQRRSPGQLASIRTAYSSMKAAAAGKADPVLTDGAFHDAILVASNNRFFQPFAAMIRTALITTAPITNAIFGHSVGDLEAHGNVLTAIGSFDPEGARDAMERMLAEVLDAVTCTRRIDTGLHSSSDRRSKGNKQDHGEAQPKAVGRLAR